MELSNDFDFEMDLVGGSEADSEALAVTRDALTIYNEHLNSLVSLHIASKYFWNKLLNFIRLSVLIRSIMKFRLRCGPFFECFQLGTSDSVIK